MCSKQCKVMIDKQIKNWPLAYSKIKKAKELANFNMPSDILACGLLKTLAATKPNGNFMELGTGSGLSTSWIL